MIMDKINYIMILYTLGKKRNWIQLITLKTDQLSTDTIESTKYLEREEKIQSLIESIFA